MCEHVVPRLGHRRHPGGPRGLVCAHLEAHGQCELSKSDQAKSGSDPWAAYLTLCPVIASTRIIWFRKLAEVQGKTVRF